MHQGVINGIGFRVVGIDDRCNGCTVMRCLHDWGLLELVDGIVGGMCHALSA